MARAVAGARHRRRRTRSRASSASCSTRRRSCRREWPALIAILAQGSQDRPRAGARLTRCAPRPVRSASRRCSPVFCTAEGAAQASIVTKRSRDKHPDLCKRFARRAGARLRAARSAPRRHRPHPHRRAADARRRRDRALSRREGSARPARLRRPHRQDPRPARARERGLGALQARPRHRPPPDRRGAGHQPGAVGHHRAAGRGIRRRRRRARHARALDLRGRRRQAVDLLVPGRRPGANSTRSRRSFRRDIRGRRASNGATSASTIRSARTPAC